MKAVPYYIYILFALLLLASCRAQEVKPDYRIVRLQEDVKDYYNYPKGSYWVYKDSLTEEIDSFYVASFASNSGYLTETEYEHVEKMYMYITECPINRITDTIQWELHLIGPHLSYLYYVEGATLKYDDIKIALGYEPFNSFEEKQFGTACTDTFYEGHAHIQVWL